MVTGTNTGKILYGIFIMASSLFKYVSSDVESVMSWYSYMLE